MDEADQAEINRERGFGPSTTRRGEILIRHPRLDLTNPDDMQKWQDMNSLVNKLKEEFGAVDPAIEIVRTLPGNRPKRSS